MSCHLVRHFHIQHFQRPRHNNWFNVPCWRRKIHSGTVVSTGTSYEVNWKRISFSNNVKIVNIISFCHHHLTHAGLFWTAPEILRNPLPPRNGSQKADVYSVAILMYNILYRLPPFHTDSDIVALPRGNWTSTSLLLGDLSLVFKQESWAVAKMTARCALYMGALHAL